ncbi:MAG: hypothetical protein ABI551_13550 [Polyangiaceae bacterium]
MRLRFLARVFLSVLFILTPLRLARADFTCSDECDSNMGGSCGATQKCEDKCESERDASTDVADDGASAADQ